VAARALRAGFQVNTHAIGDRGNRLVLDAYEARCASAPRPTTASASSTRRCSTTTTCRASPRSA
jgi:predicted amidohydrolase YtcJ